jgi:protoporphyrinogen oxidase
MTNAHLGMNSVGPEKYFGMSLSKKSGANFILELEHNRCRALCPEGKGMVSIFWYDKAGQVVSDMNDREIERQINSAMTSCLPDQVTNITFSHIVRWDTGIAHFPVGRLSKMGELRREMETWDLPLQLCGDYLDGISSEGALQTGIEAGRNMIEHLNRK